METWCDSIRREDLETEDGHVDTDKVRALSLNTYLRYVGDFIQLGGNDLLFAVPEQVEDMMVDIYMEYTHAMEGRYPEPEEIIKHLRRPENVNARKYWTYICFHANKENWPDFVKLIREDWGIPADVPIKNEEWVRSNIERIVNERTWTAREL